MRLGCAELVEKRVEHGSQCLTCAAWAVRVAGDKIRKAGCDESPGCVRNRAAPCPAEARGDDLDDRAARASFADGAWVTLHRAATLRMCEDGHEPKRVHTVCAERQKCCGCAGLELDEEEAFGDRPSAEIRRVRFERRVRSDLCGKRQFELNLGGGECVAHDLQLYDRLCVSGAVPAREVR